MSELDTLLQTLKWDMGFFEDQKEQGYPGQYDMFMESFMTVYRYYAGKEYGDD